MKRILFPLLLAILALTIFPAFTEGPVTFADDLVGEFVYPEGCTPEDALYIYRYRYPQLAGEGQLVEMFNTNYQYTAEDALGFEAPMLATEMQPGDPQKVVDISYEVTCLNDDWLSLRLCKSVTVMGVETRVYSAHVFALTGFGTGRITNLPTFLGMLDPEETDEWLLNRQTKKADTVVRDMVWSVLQERSCEAFTLYDDLTFDEFEASFYPEEDFFLAENGDVTFFIPAGVCAPEEDGEILITFTFEEIDDEM